MSAKGRGISVHLRKNIRSAKIKREIIEVKFADWEDWYEGTIVKINDNDTFKIKFDDAESRRHGSSYDKVKRKYMRPRDSYDEALLELEKLTKLK